jgi:anthranilate synthase/aminodeoxychorismate synthase-like glutamine amidotransferase
MNGKTSPIRHRGEGLFAGLSDPFEATRYHSLEVRRDTLTEALVPTAWTDDGILMGMRHRALPWWGVQFHPESVLTREGPLLLANFLALCGEATSRGAAAAAPAGADETATEAAHAR